MGKSTINKTKKQAYKSVCASLSMCVYVCSHRKRSAALAVDVGASAVALPRLLPLSPSQSAAAEAIKKFAKEEEAGKRSSEQRSRVKQGKENKKF